MGGRPAGWQRRAASWPRCKEGLWGAAQSLGWCLQGRGASFKRAGTRGTAPWGQPPARRRRLPGAKLSSDMRSFTTSGESSLDKSRRPVRSCCDSPSNELAWSPGCGPGGHPGDLRRRCRTPRTHDGGLSQRAQFCHAIYNTAAGSGWQQVEPGWEGRAGELELDAADRPARELASSPWMRVSCEVAPIRRLPTNLR